MKSYTDIEQSKKLANILSIESADMCYIKHASSDNPNWEFNEDFPPMILGNVSINEITAETLPCWSLVALLEEIPEVINFDDDENDYTLEILKEGGFYYLSYGNPLEHGKIEIEPQENFVDACVELILKLKKQNLL